MVMRQSVRETCSSLMISSSTEPVEFRVNLARPLAKPKYSLVTDSELVP